MIYRTGLVLLAAIGVLGFLVSLLRRRPKKPSNVVPLRGPRGR